MDYIFQFSAMDAAALLPQVRRALDKRAELFPASDRPKRRKPALPFVLSAIPTAAGAALWAVGAMTPKKRKESLAAGAMGIAAGAGMLLLGLGLRKAPFEEEARLLLERPEDLPRDQTVQAVFSPAGIVLVDGEEAKTVLYHDVAHVIEEEDIFLISFREQVTVLQKKDLTGDVDGFRAFIAARTPLVGY